MKPLRKLSLANLLAAIFLAACNGVVPGTIAPTMESMATSSPEMTAALPTPIENDTWKTYHSAQAGYSVAHPADWIVDEQVGSDGTSVTSFSAPDGSTGFMVMVQNGEFGAEGSSDLPNTRCEEVKVSGLMGTRCLDTLSFSLSTTFVSQGKTYIISSTSKRQDRTIYDRFLASFQLL